VIEVEEAWGQVMDWMKGRPPHCRMMHQWKPDQEQTQGHNDKDITNIQTPYIQRL